MINRKLVLERWNKCEILREPNKEPMFENLARQVVMYRTNFYNPVYIVTGVPWYVVAAFDMREEGFRHDRYLGNGDPLYKRTTHVPTGRGPFKTWSDGAIDALTLNGWNKLPPGGEWDIVTTLIKMEQYNGMGYWRMGIPSPYIWGGTSIQESGKYTSDGKFDPDIWDDQPGCAGLMIALNKYQGVGII